MSISSSDSQLSSHTEPESEGESSDYGEKTKLFHFEDGVRYRKKERCYL